MAYHLAKSIYTWATSKEEYSILLLGLDNAGKTTLLNSIKTIYSSPGTADVHETEQARQRRQDMLQNRPAPAPTVGQNVATITLPDMDLRIWDIGGQASLRHHLWTSYYEVCHAIVFVVDSCDLGDEGMSQAGGSMGMMSPTSPRTMVMPTSPLTGIARGMAMTTAVAEYGRLEECQRTLEAVLNHPATESVPLLVLANKQDREDCVETVRIKEGLVRKVFEQGEGKVRDSRVLPVSALRGDGVSEAIDWLRTRVTWNRAFREPIRRS